MQNTNKEINLILIFACLLLGSGLLLGILAAFAFINPVIGSLISFRHLRPLHVSSAVFWILSAATGSTLFFMRRYTNTNKKSIYSKAYSILWISTILIILGCFVFGNFGGREYWEYPPILGIPILFAWILFAIDFFKMLLSLKGKQPVFIWMWATGVVFFVLTFIESNLWMIPWFRDNIIRDITLQWKSNGSLVGSWNMLVYGISIYILEKNGNDKNVAYSKQSFFFYFLGLGNLMFNWGHHTYILPAAPWIRDVSYIVSMTEWVVLFNIFRNSRKTFDGGIFRSNDIIQRFLFSAELWIMLNLCLAILMSIPAINIYTHGTHITVAHAMGTTIGINSMILFASIFYIISLKIKAGISKAVFIALWIVNISLLIFWLSLIAAGLVKGYYSIYLHNTDFRAAMDQITPYLYSFTLAGMGLAAGFLILCWIAVRLLFSLKHEQHHVVQ